jgi:RimJ/RimL family protein N-acetyltransferase
VLETERLVLRSWRLPADADALQRVYEHPDVTSTLSPMTRELTEAQIRRFMAREEEDGFTVWAAELKETGRLVGRIGILRQPKWELDPGAVEVGWVVARPLWGQGLATEGGAASLGFGFQRGGLDRIISFTLPHNVASRRVMEKVGLTYRGLATWAGRPHVWYAIERAAWTPAGTAPPTSSGLG